MSSPRRLVICALLPLWVAGAPRIARAQEAVPAGAAAAPQGAVPDTSQVPNEGMSNEGMSNEGMSNEGMSNEGMSEDELQDTFDDPKLARRLGAPVELAPGSPVAAETAQPGLEPVAGEGPAPTRTPRLILAYRRFSFAQIAPAGASGPGASEPFDVVSLDFYPISSSWRFGLTTQYGWQEGTFRQGGDAFIAQSVSFGGQIPGPVLTPFIEAYGGGGLLQRTKSDLGLNSIATAYGQLGVDVGTDVFLARHFCLSFAIGYIHAGDLFGRQNVLDSFSVDTWSFKVGMGL
jgi:hypothetical protein